MSKDYNMATLILDSLKTDLFIKLKEKGLTTNIILLKFGIEKPYFALKEKGKSISIPDGKIVDMLLNNIISIDSYRLCNFSINKSYIVSQLQDNPLTILLYSKGNKKDTRKKVDPVPVLTGLLTVKFMTKNKKSVSYIPVICGKRGQGSSLLKVAEEIAVFMNHNRIELTSLDAPLGFYLYKGFQLKQGDDIYNLSDRNKLRVYKEDTEEDYKGKNREVVELLNLSKKSKRNLGTLNSNGHIRTLNNTMVSLPIKNSRKSASNSARKSDRLALKSSRYLKDGMVDTLYNIHKTDNGIYLFKDL